MLDTRCSMLYEQQRFAMLVQEEQKFHLANLADNITLKFESILNHALPKSVSEAMAPLVDTLKKIAERDHSSRRFSRHGR